MRERRVGRGERLGVETFGKWIVDPQPRKREGSPVLDLDLDPYGLPRLYAGGSHVPAVTDAGQGVAGPEMDRSPHEREQSGREQ
jgi:hypothetical protein